MKQFCGRYWKKNDDNIIQCELCPRLCEIKDGNRGFCFVRKNENGRIIQTAYNKASGFCVDPVEKKPLYHFLPGTNILSFGSVGCNLACTFCQNWELSHNRSNDRLIDDVLPHNIPALAKKSDSLSVAFTYNEPIISFEFVIDTAKECRKNRIKTAAVTAGYISEEPRIEFFEVLDAANVDLKSFSEDFYKKYCGASLMPVLETLKYIKKNTSVWLEITTLIIPELNDSDDEIERLTDWVVSELGTDVPLHFSAFHPAGRMLDRKQTPASSLIRARDIALKKKIKYVYTGNLRNSETSTTYCSNCGRELIIRDGYLLLKYNLDNHGNCSFCGERCSGVFTAQ